MEALLYLRWNVAEGGLDGCLGGGLVGFCTTRNLACSDSKSSGFITCGMEIVVLMVVVVVATGTLMGYDDESTSLRAGRDDEKSLDLGIVPCFACMYAVVVAVVNGCAGGMGCKIFFLLFSMLNVLLVFIVSWWYIADVWCLFFALRRLTAFTVKRAKIQKTLCKKKHGAASK